MRIRKISSFGWLLILAGVFASQAKSEEPIRIFAGGPAVEKKLKMLADKIQKVAGRPIEVHTASPEIGLAGLRNGIADIISTGIPPKMAIAGARKKDPSALAGFDESILVTGEMPKTEIWLGVTPQNPVTSLSPDQMKAILSGKEKNWNAISGWNMPITIFIAANSPASHKAVFRHFTGEDSSSLSRPVSDRVAQLKALENNPGALIVISSREDSPQMKPKYFETGVKVGFFLSRKKTAPDDVKRAYDFILPLDFNN